MTQRHCVLVKLERIRVGHGDGEDGHVVSVGEAGVNLGQSDQRREELQHGNGHNFRGADLGEVEHDALNGVIHALLHLQGAGGQGHDAISAAFSAQQTHVQRPNETPLRRLLHKLGVTRQTRQNREHLIM